MDKTYSVVVGGNTTFDLLTWDRSSFNMIPSLKIINSNFDAIKQAFTEYETLEIYYGNDLMASFLNYDYFESISYSTSEEDIEGNPVEAIVITLQKKDIYQMVESLSHKINPVIDYQSMGLEEYKQYRLKQVSDECTQDICDGCDVTFSNGAVETFSFTEKDQTDLQALANLAMGNPSLSLAWHSNGQPCRMYSGIDIIIIYQTLYMKLLRDTTVCNAINMLIRNAQTKEEVENYYWGCELPEESQENVDAILDNMTAIVNGIKAQYVPEQDAPSNEEE